MGLFIYFRATFGQHAMAHELSEQYDFEADGKRKRVPRAL
jgi:hypothetical protein